MTAASETVKRASIWALLYIALHYLAYRFIRIFWAPSDNDRLEQPAAAKVVVITGANGGLGKEVGIAMGDRGATVILGCRNLKQGQASMKHIRRVTGSDRLILLHLDLSDLNSVRMFASKVQKQFPKIHLLINNAGIHSRADELEYTKDGFETHFGINHLGHFLLTNLLLPNLKRAAPSRVVTVSSTFQILEELKMNDLNMKKHGNKSIYGDFNNSNMTYANSKYANSLFTYELGYRLKNTGVTTYSLCPGILKTDLHFAQKDKWNWIKKILNSLKLALFGFNPKEGLETVLYCALSNHCKDETGLMYHFSKRFDICNQKYNREKSKQLWEKSEIMVGGFK